jgi:hypothetical protein
VSVEPVQNVTLVSQAVACVYHQLIMIRTDLGHSHSEKKGKDEKNQEKKTGMKKRRKTGSKNSERLVRVHSGTVSGY